MLSFQPLDPHVHPATEESLRTFFAGVQRILNARPLTEVSGDVDDYDIITPATLLHGSTDFTNPIGSFPPAERIQLNFKEVQVQVDNFWILWMSQYLPFLQRRQKNLLLRRNLKIGDLVLIADLKTARSQYPLAHVVEVFPDDKGNVRSARVRTPNYNSSYPKEPPQFHEYRRDLSKLALIEAAE